jgi:alpha-beta hydrolase superfamily lysophospholipase
MKTFSIYRQAKAIAVFLAIFIGGICNASERNDQDVTGQWNGVLSFQGTNLRIVFHIQKSGDSYTSTMDSPDQGATGIPVTSVAFDGSKLSLAISNAGILYEGEFKTDSITGTFKQGGMSFPITLKKTSDEIKPFNRPQEPKPPFPYRSEDLTFESQAAGVTLAGTLTMPATGSNFPAVILISGSGAQDRNEEIMGHKPFLVIADYLTRRGIAVLRYDDRGFAQSTGDFRTATTADFATDAESAVAYMKTRKEINPQKIGLMGHSEGGIIASMVAARSNDVGFIVMLAGTGMRGDSILLLQTALIAKASGMPDDKIARAAQLNAKIYSKIVNATGLVSQQEMIDRMTALKDELAEFVPDGTSLDVFIRTTAAQITAPWMQYFLRYDPVPALERVKCPVLAVIGCKDLQVPAKENIPAIRRALKRGGNTKATVKEYPGLNHLFQECTTGAPAEYASIEQTFSPDVLKDLGDWILNNYELGITN